MEGAKLSGPLRWEETDIDKAIAAAMRKTAMALDLLLASVSGDLRRSISSEVDEAAYALRLAAALVSPLNDPELGIDQSDGAGEQKPNTQKGHHEGH